MAQARGAHSTPRSKRKSRVDAEAEWEEEVDFGVCSWPAQCVSVFVCTVCGVLDGVRLYRTAIFLLTSSTIQRRTGQCLLLNGGIFLVSVLLGEWLLAPLLRALLSMDDFHSFPALPWWLGSAPLPSLSSLFLWLYYAMWVYPVYCLSFVLSSLWYQDIADAAVAARDSPAHTASTPTAATFRRWVMVMSEEMYRLLLVTCFLCQLSALSFLPYGLGTAVAFVHLSWLHALYSFDYKWSHDGWQLATRLYYFECRWSYFLGFGAPAAALTFFTPRLIGAAIFSATFPLLLILAVTARPQPSSRPLAPALRSRSHAPLLSAARWARPVFRLPLFYFAQRLNLALLTRLRAWQIQQQGSREREAAAESTHHIHSAAQQIHY